MALDLQTVSQLLQASLDPRQQKQAEAEIRQSEAQPQFSILLLQITAAADYPQTSRLAAALYFKNFVRRNWIDADGNHKLPQNEVAAIKQELVSLMVQVPPSIQAQLGDAISEIASSDFWRQWTTLTDDLVSRLTPDNTQTNNGVLRVAHSIFKRWRPLFPSNELNLEIKQEGGKFCMPFLSLLQSTNNSIEQNQQNKQSLEAYMSTLHLCIKVLHDLSCQDLLEGLEENISGICTLLNTYLQYDNPLLHTDDDSEPGQLEFVKGEIFELLSLWVLKYDEDIRSSVSTFANTTWNFLTNLGQETKYDVVASRALQFLTRICASREHAEGFNSDETLQQVVERVVLPNLAFRTSDEELFEDEPMQYVRRDLEGTDSETRRRAATDFLRALMQQFQERVTAVVMNYVNQYLQSASGDDAWRSKDTAIYLYCSIAAVGAVTAAHGVKTVNSKTDILQFFSANVAQNLVSDSAHPILQTDAIKYLYMFRTQLSVREWQEAFPLLVGHLSSSNVVIRTYASIAIERVLAVTDANNQPFISRQQLAPQAQELVKKLLILIEKDPAAEKLQENEFLMRCVMRVLIVVREDMQPYTDFLTTNFVNIIKVIRHNPSNPLFYYYLFEAVGALIRFAGPANSEKLGQAFFGPFSEILSNDVQEFVPYVFQLFTALLESDQSAALPEYYQGLIQPVLMPVLWESKGNTPALAALLSALVTRGASTFVANNQLEAVLGLFQKLIASKANDIYGFDILEAVMSSVSLADLQKYFITILNLLLTRLSGSKTQQFTFRFVRLYHFMSSLDSIGADNVIAAFEQVQQGVFAQLYTGVLLPGSQELVRPQDRKIAVISFTKTLANSQRFADQYAKGWSHTCEALLKIMLVPPTLPAADDVIIEQDTEDAGFGVGFTKLTTCTHPPRDLFPDITDLRSWIGTYLREADGKFDGRVTKFVQERLSNETRQTLLTYMQGGQANGA